MFRAKLSHVEDVYITHGTWQNIGGLLGELILLCYSKIIVYSTPKKN